LSISSFFAVPRAKKIKESDQSGKSDFVISKNRLYFRQNRNSEKNGNDKIDTNSESNGKKNSSMIPAQSLLDRNKKAI